MVVRLFITFSFRLRVDVGWMLTGWRPSFASEILSGKIRYGSSEVFVGTFQNSNVELVAMTLVADDCFLRIFFSLWFFAAIKYIWSEDQRRRRRERPTKTVANDTVVRVGPASTSVRTSAVVAKDPVSAWDKRASSLIERTFCNRIFHPFPPHSSTQSDRP